MKFEEAARVRLGLRLRHIRMQHGRTMKQVADEIGVSTPAMWRWEKGEVRPREKNLRAFADIFNMSEAELLSGLERPLENEAASQRRAESLTAVPHEAQPVLSEIIDESKQRIAKAAGASPAQIKIIIEV